MGILYWKPVLMVIPHIKKDQQHQEWRKGPGVSADQRWNFWPALPIAPYERRLTKRYEVVPGSG